MLNEPMDMGKVVTKTAEALVKVAGYYRVLVSIVDPKRKSIQEVASYCKKPAKRITLGEDHGIPGKTVDTADLDVHPWVVRTGRVAVIPNARIERRDPTVNTTQARKLGMRCITVVPIELHREVIGTLHLELENGVQPTSDEIGLFQTFATQLAAVFRQAQVITLLNGAINALGDKIRIVDPNGHVMFVNTAGAEELGMLEGAWLRKTTKCKCARSEASRSCLIDEFTKGSDEDTVSHYITDEANQTAYEWQMARIKDFRAGRPDLPAASGVIGYVEQVHDVTLIYQIMEAIKSWQDADSVQDAARRIVGWFAMIRGHAWVRVYHVEGSGTDAVLESVHEHGLNDQEKARAFRSGQFKWRDDSQSGLLPWYPLHNGMPAVYTNNPSLEIGAVKKAEADYKGFPHFETGGDFCAPDLNRGEDESWIGAPMLVAGKPIGLISLSMPEEMGRVRWELLKMAVQFAALAMERAARIDDMKKVADSEAQIRAWKEVYMRVAHQVGNRIGAVGSLMSYLQRKLHGVEGLEDVADYQVPRLIASVEDARSFLREFPPLCNRDAIESPTGDA